jgi:hypothetical protein
VLASGHHPGDPQDPSGKSSTFQVSLPAGQPSGRTKERKRITQQQNGTHLDHYEMIDKERTASRSPPAPTRPHAPAGTCAQWTWVWITMAPLPSPKSAAAARTPLKRARVGISVKGGKRWVATRGCDVRHWGMFGVGVAVVCLAVLRRERFKDRKSLAWKLLCLN